MTQIPDDADWLAHEVARTSEETSNLSAEIERIGRRVHKRPLLDLRTAEEILGYDEYGIP